MNGFKIIGDSCVSAKKEMFADMDFEFVPFQMIIGDTVFTDAEDFDVPPFLEAMHNSPTGAKSGAPAPHEFTQRFNPDKDNFVIIISSAMSCCYENALKAAEDYKTEHPDTKVHVFDTKSAAAGEANVFLRIKDGIKAGKTFEEIVEDVEGYIKELQTVFVLGRLDTMYKNGRMSKVENVVANILNIHPILMADREGAIAIAEKHIGMKKALNRLAEKLGDLGVSTTGKRVYITHCNNEQRGLDMKAKLEKLYDFSEIIVAPTRGLGSMYLEDGGVIVTF